MFESKSAAAKADEMMLTEDEAADVLDVSSQTLARWRTKKIGPPYVRIRNRWVRYIKSDVIAFRQSTIVRCSA